VLGAATAGGCTTLVSAPLLNGHHPLLSADAGVCE